MEASKAVVAIVVAMVLLSVLLVVALTCFSCLQYNNCKASDAPATFDGLNPGSMPSRAVGSVGGRETSLEAGETGARGAPTHNVDDSGGRRRGQPGVPVRYLSRRWPESWGRRSFSEAQTSPPPTPFLEGDRGHRLPSYRFLFRAPPPQHEHASPGATATTTTTDGNTRADPLVSPATDDQGPKKRSLASYFSKSPKRKGAATAREAARSAEKKSGSTRAIEHDGPRRRRELSQYASVGSLASWHGAPPPAYVSMKKVAAGRKLSPPPPEYDSSKNVTANASSSVTGPSSSAEEVLPPAPPEYDSSKNVTANASSSVTGPSSSAEEVLPPAPPGYDSAKNVTANASSFVTGPSSSAEEVLPPAPPEYDSAKNVTANASSSVTGPSSNAEEAVDSAVAEDPRRLGTSPQSLNQAVDTTQRLPNGAGGDGE